MNTTTNIHADLSKILTEWQDVREAHASGPGARAAQERIVERYGPAAVRYLCVLTQDEDLAKDLFQQFAKRLAEGRLRNADPSRGKFRHYVKTTLVHLYKDHMRRVRCSRVQFLAEPPEPVVWAGEPGEESDAEFLSIWRKELLRRGLEVLRECQQKTGRALLTALELRMLNPNARSRQLAQLFTEATGQPLSIEGYRKLLFEARRKFSSYLLRLVEETLEDGESAGPSLDEVEEELIELQLLPYCRKALQERRGH